MARFTNELGREIAMSVERLGQCEWAGGVWAQGVKIVMEGPDSTTENVITEREAEALLALLKDAL